jgi:hypothetical protein
VLFIDCGEVTVSEYVVKDIYLMNVVHASEIAGRDLSAVTVVGNRRSGSDIICSQGCDFLYV